MTTPREQALEAALRALVENVEEAHPHLDNMCVTLIDEAKAARAALAMPPPAPEPDNNDPEAIKTAYKRGWSDREADILERMERVAPPPEPDDATVERVARAIERAWNGDAGGGSHLSLNWEGRIPEARAAMDALVALGWTAPASDTPPPA